MSDVELEAIKTQWDKIYKAVELRGRPEGFSFHLDIPRFVALRDNVLTLTIPQIADTAIEFEWRDMMTQCACGARNALADAIRFITGLNVAVEFESYDGSRTTNGVSDDEAAAFLNEGRLLLQAAREQRAQAERARWESSKVPEIRPTQTVSLDAELIPAFLDWPGTGAGTLFVSPEGVAAFAARDGLRTHLGRVSDLFANYQVDRAGSIRLNFTDIKIATGDMLPVSMMTIHVPSDSVPPDLLGHLAYWGVRGERAAC